MKFYNFWNAQTYHFFVWLTESGHADPALLIARAFARAETGAEHLPAEEVSEIVRDHLGGLLQELLEEIAPNAGRERGPMIGTVSSASDGYTSLCLPILTHALLAIDCGTVAEALLIRAGKWSPEVGSARSC